MANALTLARILLVIPFIFVFLTNAPWNMTAALVIFVIAAATDFLDGYIARRHGDVSSLGAVLDPLADKLIVAAALILLVKNGVIREAGVLAVLIIILREILVSGLREGVALTGGALKVTGLAKFKTTAQLLACGLLIAAAPNGLLSNAGWAQTSGALVLWLAALLTFLTGADYARKAAGHLQRVGAGEASPPEDD